MKRLLTLVLLSLFALPALAQDSTQTYTLNTGTSIDYPDGWIAETSDDLVILSLGQSSRAIVIDYPIVDVLTNNIDTTLTNSLLALGREALEVEIAQSDIEPFAVGERSAVRWTTRSDNGSPLSLVAINFDNGSIGMLLTVGVSELTLLDMVASFDNSQPALEATSTPMGQIMAPDRDSLFFFNDGARFTLPQGWSGNLQRLDPTSVMRLVAPDSSVEAVLMNLLTVVSEDTALADVLDATGFDGRLLALNYVITNSEAIRIGNRDGLRYTLDVTIEGNQVMGELVITEYSDGGFGLVLAYGTGLETFRSDLNILIGSLNNALYGLDYRS